MPETPRNPAATTGLILGLASILFYEVGLVPILAIVFSGIGLSKGPTGKGKAIAGLVLGILYTLVSMST